MKPVIALALLSVPAMVQTAIGLEILAPFLRCGLEKGDVVVIGSAPGVEEGFAEWSGRRIRFRVRSGRFSFVLNLDPGEQQVRFTAGGKAVETRWAVGTRSKGPLFRYHYKVARGECGVCHDRLGGSADEPGVSGVCYACHEAYGARKHVHGPVAAGGCTECHSPHGSVHLGMVRTPRAELCGDCHEEPESESHSARAAGSTCLSCHDPHGTDRPYFLKGS